MVIQHQLCHSLLLFFLYFELANTSLFSILVRNKQYKLIILLRWGVPRDLAKTMEEAFHSKGNGDDHRTYTRHYPRRSVLQRPLFSHYCYSDKRKLEEEEETNTFVVAVASFSIRDWVIKRWRRGISCHCFYVVVTRNASSLPESEARWRRL
jgi:hypothetical protein